ncbi:hypothetical protein HHK36_022452 [Tetracentron sinense]|uniref:Stalled ribosome sensor GCN1-like HEAT repeats region domain-containing protein n=1 Tax=Tetracentron sinense TaxID=13715 RepID=A0A834YQZ5_TETSI|nr:hypothetical protein HHK36_022452 [Tetracentron sinense]
MLAYSPNSVPEKQIPVKLEIPVKLVDHLEIIGSALGVLTDGHEAAARRLYQRIEEVAEVAEDIWDRYGYDFGTHYSGLLKALSHVNYNVRLAAAEAIAAALDENPETIQEALLALFSLYIRDVDSAGNNVDSGWLGRQGIALALHSAADVLRTKDLPVVMTFLLSRSLADPNTDVRERMINAGIMVIDKHGGENISLLFPIFENYLNKKASNEEKYDLVREGVVIFTGALAKHLAKDDPKVHAVVEKLLDVLNTPSEAVQRAVSTCLSPLMHSKQNDESVIKAPVIRHAWQGLAVPAYNWKLLTTYSFVAQKCEDAQALVSRLLDQLMRSDKYGERRGAAFGLAGVVKGFGISCLKKYGIVSVLWEGLEDRKINIPQGSWHTGWKAFLQSLAYLRSQRSVAWPEILELEQRDRSECVVEPAVEDDHQKSTHGRGVLLKHADSLSSQTLGHPPKEGQLRGGIGSALVIGEAHSVRVTPQSLPESKIQGQNSVLVAGGLGGRPKEGAEPGNLIDPLESTSASLRKSSKGEAFVSCLASGPSLTWAKEWASSKKACGLGILGPAGLEKDGNSISIDVGNSPDPFGIVPLIQKLGQQKRRDSSLELELLFKGGDMKTSENIDASPSSVEPLRLGVRLGVDVVSAPKSRGNVPSGIDGSGIQREVLRESKKVEGGGRSAVGLEVQSPPRYSGGAWWIWGCGKSKWSRWHSGEIGAIRWRQMISLGVWFEILRVTWGSATRRSGRYLKGSSGSGIRSRESRGNRSARNSAKSREGALLGFECLCEKLGRLFEPYVIQMLPLLLVSFSDQVVAVREAAECAAHAMMSQISGQGVKLVLPSLIEVSCQNVPYGLLIPIAWQMFAAVICITVLRITEIHSAFGLEDKSWRTKQSSVQLLGAMAYCAPQQLSQCLPKIVPKLTEVLTDTHPKVQSAGQMALQQIGSVIKNPEISALVPTLLMGLADPNVYTKHSLDILLQTTFVNSIDAPSLALLVPIVHRGLRERSADTKKKAAQIAGNMCSLVTDSKDMIPYMGLLLPEVKKVLSDPIPEVRSVAARALGSLIKGMGEENFPDLVSWFLDTLKSDNSNVERSGAAQGLSEVLAALGKEYFEHILPDIIRNCSHQRASVRDGYLTLFKYLPRSLGVTFQDYLQQVLPAILDGLADENESVRDAALSAGHVLVEHYATTSLPLLLPAVEDGIFNDNWRIRQSSVELLGDLLFKVAGTSGKAVLEGGSDDEGSSTEAHGRAIIEILGRDKRNEVLAALYMVRTDVSISVRQAALHVWKTIVANTPKTLKEIMPVLMSTLITSLASSSSERRQAAGRALGELVRKLGERVLPLIIPILSQGLEDPDTIRRQGVCIGLSEVMACSGKNQLLSFMDELIPTIRTALCDSMPEVRESAGLAFSTLYKSAGMQAIDEIVPTLLHALEDDKISDTALDGLKQILRTAAVLPHILPKLVHLPLSAFNAHALGALAEVAGPGLDFHLGTVLPALLSAMSDDNMDVKNLAKKAAETVVLVIDEEGVESLILELLKGVNDNQASIRRSSSQLIGYFFKNSKLYLVDEAPNMISTLIIMLSDSDSVTVAVAWEALSRVVGAVPKEVLPSYIKLVRDAVSTSRDKERRKKKGGPVLIPGFCLPKALQPLLPIFLQMAMGFDEVLNCLERDNQRGKHGLSSSKWGGLAAGIARTTMMVAGNLSKLVLSGSALESFGCSRRGLISGSAELREQAAQGLGELIEVTSEQALKEFVVPITGPLIRIIGDRFPWQVKGAILSTLRIIISKGGMALKPFLPQLQTTFIKCLQDNARTVRSSAAIALGKLSALITRVDPLVSDLLSTLQASDGGVREAVLTALKGVLKHAGKSVGSTVKSRVYIILEDLIHLDDDQVRSSAASVLGTISQYMEESKLLDLLHTLSTMASSSTWSARHGSVLTISSMLRYNPSMVCLSPAFSSVLDCLKDSLKDDKFPVRKTVTKALGRLLLHQAQNDPLNTTAQLELLPFIVSALHDDSSEVKRRALSSLKTVAKANTTAITAYLKNLGPALAECLKDGNTPVRLAAERCALHVFQLAKGMENVQASQKFITGLDARRLSKLPEHSNQTCLWFEEIMFIELETIYEMHLKNVIVCGCARVCTNLLAGFGNAVMGVKTVKMTRQVAERLAAHESI